MTQRERLMAVIVAGAVVLLGGGKLVQSQIVAPWRELNRKLTVARQRKSDLGSQIARAPATQRIWGARVARTLGIDPAEAHQMFREDVADLMEKNGLTEELSVQPQKPIVTRKGFRKDFVQLPIVASAKGTLEAVVNFQRDFYAKPYLARITKLSLTAQGTGRARGGSKKRSRARNSSNESPKLSVTIHARALVLPKVEGVDAEPIDLANATAIEPPLLALAELSGYDEIAKVDFFKIFEPKRVVVVPLEPPDDNNKPPPSPPVRRDPRKDYLMLKVVGVGTENGPVTWIMDEDNLADPPAKKRVGDEMDYQGRVILIHPKGVVVRFNETKNDRTETKEYFYPLGKSFEEREPLDPAEHPEVARELRLVRGR